MFNYEKFRPIIPEREPIGYENTIFKEQAEDIKQSNEKVMNKIEEIANDAKKSGHKAFVISVITLIVAGLTLIATVIGIFAL